MLLVSWDLGRRRVNPYLIYVDLRGTAPVRIGPFRTDVRGRFRFTA